MSQASRAAEQQTAQRGLLAELVRELAEVWAIIRLGAFATTIPQWIAAVQLLIRQYAAMSATLAGDSYDVERNLAQVGGRFTFPTPDPPLQEKVEASLRWATRDLWIPEQRDPPPIEQRLRAAEVKAAGAAQKVVADAGRDAVIAAVEDDPEALGWFRVAAPNACSFCRVLAIRGPVYESQETADFQAHDSCSCTAAPVFQGQTWEPPADVAEWRRLYQDSTRGERNKLKAFRRAVEGR